MTLDVKLEEQISQDEEEEPYTMKTKTSAWRDEEVPEPLVMRAAAVWTSCELFGSFCVTPPPPPPPPGLNLSSSFSFVLQVYC